MAHDDDDITPRGNAPQMLHKWRDKNNSSKQAMKDSSIAETPLCLYFWIAAALECDDGWVNPPTTKTNYGDLWRTYCIQDKKQCMGRMQQAASLECNVM